MIRFTGQVTRAFFDGAAAFSGTLLFAGALCGFFAFLIPTIFHLRRFAGPLGANVFGEHFKSGNNYCPQSVSELTMGISRDALLDDPLGRFFKNLMLVGNAACMTSRYTFIFQNADAGGLWFASLRGVLAHLFMLIGVMFPVYNNTRSNAGVVKVNDLFHTAFVVGGSVLYGVAELRCLLKAEALGMQKPEKILRWTTAVVGLITIIGYVSVNDGYLSNTSNASCCCDNEWWTGEEVLDKLSSDSPDDEGLRVVIALMSQAGGMILKNTASGMRLYLTQFCLLSEAVAGMALYMNVFWIWYYRRECRSSLPTDTTLMRESRGVELGQTS